MSVVAPPDAQTQRFRRFVRLALLVALVPACLAFLLLMRVQAPGVDFLPLWAGARTALSDPGRIYDFHFVTALQGWPMGPGSLRPFIYPPSALLAFAPFAILPQWVAYALWTAATGAGFVWASRRLGAPWWLVAFPVFWLVAYVGQVAFLIGGLVMTALTLPKRPLMAGVLLGVAAAIKPQMLLFMPLALLAEGRWRTMLAAGLTGLLLCAVATGFWGIEAWTTWFSALGRFQRDVVFADPSLVEDMITPYAGLIRLGLPGAWAFLLAPLAAWLVWIVFRRSDDPADRTIAVFAAAILVSPYAMNYENALLLPGVAAYLARDKARHWMLYAAVAGLFAMGMGSALAVAAALSLPLSTLLSRRAAVT